jgi:putative acyl-CoA dehydrogenase
MTAHHDTHEVFNQSPPFVDVALFAVDRPLQDAVAANGARDQTSALSSFGKHWGTAEMADQARLANENRPKLMTFDARGFRRDTVEFHPAYHQFMAESIGAGMTAMTWNADGTRAAAPAEVARAARYYMIAQVENGHMCPVTMTRAAIGALPAAPALLAQVMPKICSRKYDARFLPWTEKSGVTIGMGMTEKQGGTDVRANTTQAVADGDGYRITGHKWFMSAPMCDMFLVLAQTPGGLTCFLMPRFTPDGAVNALRFQRLKDKLGNISNASSEVEFENAFAWRIGEEGRGVRTIIDMVQLTRLDCAIASTGMIRAGLTHALHHARYRTVFQRHLSDQPLMATVIADLALESEGAVAAMMRLCRSYDLAGSSLAEAARARTLTPVVKYWVCKTAPGFIYEAMECLGGNGYVEEGVLARLYREAPVNAIWEGSGNVVCLDLLRALSRDGDAARAVLGEIAKATRELPGCAEAIKFVERTLSSPTAEAHARAAIERLALLCAVEALQVGAPEIAAIFAQARLAERSGRSYGTVDLSSAQSAMLMERALPSA